MPLDPAILTKAQRHLSRRDPVLKRVRALIGPCTLQTEPDTFLVLVRAILSQMISTKAANAIFTRLCAALPRGNVTPANLLSLKVDELRAVGLSRAKVAGLHDLAERAATGVLPLKRFDTLSDDEVIDHLVQVRCIGRWTAEMVLIFSLGRLDVLPVDDFGLRAGVKEQYGLEELPGRAALQELGEPWRPYRSIATWYFWKSRGWVPQSEEP